MSGLEFYDLSHWRRFRLLGRDRKQFLQGLVTNDVLRAAPRQELPCCLLTPKGKLQAHFWYYDLGEESLLVCPDKSAYNLETAIKKVILLSDSILADDSTREVLYWAAESSAKIHEGIALPFSALGQPGSLVLPSPQEAAAFKGTPLSEADFTRRRIEHGLPLFGVDMDEDTIPLEARLENAISFTKGCYMGQETISRIHHMGHVNKTLVGLKFDGAVPAVPAPVLRDGKEVGCMTSAAAGLALATVRFEQAQTGAQLTFGERTAVVVDFWR